MVMQKFLCRETKGLGNPQRQNAEEVMERVFAGCAPKECQRKRDIL